MYDRTLMKNDIGMVKTSISMTFTQYVQSIALPLLPLPMNTSLTVTGWGLNQVLHQNFYIFIFVYMFNKKIILDRRNNTGQSARINGLYSQSYTM